MSPEAEEFIELLQLELAQHELELTSYPAVALQIQQLLADDNVSTERVVRLVGTEPILAAMIVRLASSVALNPTGKPVVDLRNAVARVGFNAMRAAATSFALTQLRLSKRYRPVLEQLEALWRDNVSMAAAACVVARRSQRVSADTALFAGLVSGVGKICLLARSVDSPYMMSHPDEFREVVLDWHAEVAHALLTSWRVADDVVEAVHGHQGHRTGTRNLFVLSDVLSVAEVMAQHEMATDLRLELLESQLAAKRLGLRPENYEFMMTESKAELALLIKTLGI